MEDSVSRQVAIHAAAKRHSDAELPKRSRKPRPEDVVCGAILGVVEIVDVVDDSKSKWFQGEYGFVLANPRSLSKPIPCKGKLGLWDLPPHVEKLVNKRVKRKNRPRSS
jgi:hypothetical protein